MQQEIEVKFLNINHDDIRAKLKSLGAVCEVPMRIMRRKMFDYPDGRLQKAHSRLRVRDEGDGKVFINFKAKSITNYSDEIETSVGSCDAAVTILEMAGLINYSTQESKRETWKYMNVEIVLDVWPWVNTYIEIEGHDEASIKEVASKLGLAWENAKYGSVDTAYRMQYKKMTEKDSIGEVPEVTFNMPMPAFLQERK